MVGVEAKEEVEVPLVYGNGTFAIKEVTGPYSDQTQITSWHFRHSPTTKLISWKPMMVISKPICCRYLT